MKSILLFLWSCFEDGIGACPFVPTPRHLKLQVIDKSASRFFFLAFKFVKRNEEYLFLFLLHSTFRILTLVLACLF